MFHLNRVENGNRNSSSEAHFRRSETNRGSYRPRILYFFLVTQSFKQRTNLSKCETGGCKVNKHWTCKCIDMLLVHFSCIVHVHTRNKKIEKISTDSGYCKLDMHCKKGYRSSVPSRDFTNQTLPGRILLNYSRLGRVCLVTSRLGMGKTITFFYNVVTMGDMCK